MTPSQRCVRYGSHLLPDEPDVHWMSLDTMTSVCILQELETGVVDLLIPSPNATAEVGYNRDR